jgi:hypothetical protein
MIAIKSENDLDFIKKELENGKSKKDLTDKLKSKMNENQKDELNRLLKDKNALNNLLNSEKAKSILKRLTGDGNGQHK